MSATQPRDNEEEARRQVRRGGRDDARARVLLWCEACGREEFMTAEEAFATGWDFSGPGGLYPAGVVSPRTCGGCTIDKTVWWRLVVEHVPAAELTDRERGVIERILREGTPVPKGGARVAE